MGLSLSLQKQAYKIAFSSERANWEITTAMNTRKSEHSPVQNKNLAARGAEILHPNHFDLDLSGISPAKTDHGTLAWSFALENWR